MKFLNTIFNSLCIADTAPIPTTVIVGGGTLTDNELRIYFDKALNIFGIPENTDFDVVFSGGDVVATSLMLYEDEGDYFVNLLLDRSIVYGETGTIAYTGTALKGENGKVVVAFTEDVTNNVEESYPTDVEEWTNEPLTPFDTFDATGELITSAISDGSFDAVATSNAFVGEVGDEFIINFSMTVTSGDPPFVTIYDCEYDAPNIAGGNFEETFSLSEGDGGVYYLDDYHVTVSEGALGFVAMSISTSSSVNFSVTELTITKA